MILIPQYRTSRRATASAPRPLDAWSGSLVCAYSTRQLLTSYTGALLRVRRSSDSTEQDIGQSGGVLDTASLTSFVGAGTGSVVTWYDQIGANNATGIATLPRIVISGTVQQIAGGAHPAIYIATDDTAGFSGIPSPSTGVPRTVMSRLSIGSGGVGILMSTSSSSRWAGVYQNGSTTVISQGTSSSSQYLDGATATRDQAHDGLLTNDAVLACSFTTNAAWSSSEIMSYGLGVIPLAYCVDWVLFNSNLSAGDVGTVSALIGA